MHGLTFNSVVSINDNDGSILAFNCRFFNLRLNKATVDLEDCTIDTKISSSKNPIGISADDDNNNLHNTVIRMKNSKIVGYNYMAPNEDNYSGAGIRLENSDLELDNCDINGCNIGIDFYRYANLKVTNSRINHNRVGIHGVGYSDCTPDGTIEASDLTQNKKSDDMKHTDLKFINVRK